MSVERLTGVPKLFNNNVTNVQFTTCEIIDFTYSVIYNLVLGGFDQAFDAKISQQGVKFSNCNDASSSSATS